MEKRIGVVAVIIHNRVEAIDRVNELLKTFGHLVIGRLGLPYPDRGVNIINLIVDASVEDVSSLTGKIGKIPGVQVRSLMTKPFGNLGAPKHEQSPEPTNL